MGLVYNDNTGNYDWVPDEDPNQVAPQPTPVWPGTMDDANRLADHEDDWTGGTNTTGGGKSLADIEREGREYDQQHGYIGGYMSNGVWVNGSPHSGGPGGGDTAPRNFGNFSFGPSGWNWPTFNAPRFSYGEFQAPAPFEPETFKANTFAAPSLAEAEAEPGYAFARDQGIHALENNASARGVLRSGGTLKDFLSFGNKFAEQNYGNAFNRSKDVFNTNEGNRFNAFNTNEGNRFNAYQANFGNALNTYGTNRDTAEHVFDRNYKGDWDMYSSQMDASKTEFGGALQKWLAQLNSLTQLSQPVG